jgi:ferritin-like metal-binding protein YciE
MRSFLILCPIFQPGNWHNILCVSLTNYQLMPKTTAKPTSKKNDRKSSPSVPSPPPAKPDSNDLAELLTTGIKELFWVENHLVKVLPKIQESAGAAPLKKVIGEHLKVTKGQVTRLQSIFTLLGIQPQAKKSDGLEGLAMEGEGIIDSTSQGSAARNTGLIMACQKVETYEITVYKGLALLAAQLDRQDIADLLHQTMIEEQEAEDVLAGLAEKA